LSCITVVLEGATAIGTLGLAIATFVTLKHNDKSQALTRKEKLNFELREWVLDALQAYRRLSQICGVIYDADSKLIVVDEEKRLAEMNQENILEAFQNIREKGKYYRRVSSDISKDLQQNVDKLWEMVTTLIGYLEGVRISFDYAELDASAPKISDIETKNGEIGPLCNEIIEQLSQAALKQSSI
jgi:hypothetical protein